VRFGEGTTSEPALREAEERQTASLLPFRRGFSPESLPVFAEALSGVEGEVEGNLHLPGNQPDPCSETRTKTESAKAGTPATAEP